MSYFHPLDQLLRFYMFFLSLVFICSFFTICFSFWFFITRFGFSTMMLVLVFCCSLLLFDAFRCLSLPVLAYSGFSWLLIFLWSRICANEWKWECRMLVVHRYCFFFARFGFWGVFPFSVRCFLLLFVAGSCSWDRISSMSNTKTGKCLRLMGFLQFFCRVLLALVKIHMFGSYRNLKIRRQSRVILKVC